MKKLPSYFATSVCSIDMNRDISIPCSDGVILFFVLELLYVESRIGDILPTKTGYVNSRSEQRL